MNTWMSCGLTDARRWLLIHEFVNMTTITPSSLNKRESNPLAVKQIYCTRKDALNVVCVRSSIRLMCIPAENVPPTDLQKPTIISIYYYIYISISPRILIMFCEYTFQRYINKDIISFNISLWKNWDIF